MARRESTEDELEAARVVGQNLRRARRRAGLSQEELALRVGMYRTFVGTVERAEVNPTLGTLVLLAKGLEVTVAELVDGV